jgi:pSer/pThr/pTyr-binding forkhead associated (FHA) protein
MQTVLTLSGKARQVFRYLALLARYNGQVTIKDLK